MQGVALFFLLGGAIGALFWPAGTPSLEASYQLTADRWKQGEGVYTVLQAPVDPVFVAAYRYVPEEAPSLLRAWKALGVILWGLLLWGVRSREERPDPIGLTAGSLLLGVYAQVPWHTPLEVGIPLLAVFFWLVRSRLRPFEQGLLWGGAAAVFPAVSLALLGYFPFYLSRERLRALGLFLLGVGWTALGIAALLKQSELFSAYAQAYWIVVWRFWAWDAGIQLLGAVGLLGLIFRLSAYAYRPYAERLLFQDRFWAALTAWVLPGAGGLLPWAVVLAERFPRRGVYFSLYGLSLVVCLLAIQQRWRMPACTHKLPAHSCWWGPAPCYLQLEGPYGCRWTAPYAWPKSWRPEDWKIFYQKWGKPDYIFDFSHTWAEASYHLPHLALPYASSDTVAGVPVFGLQRR